MAVLGKLSAHDLIDLRPPGREVSEPPPISMPWETERAPTLHRPDRGEPERRRRSTVIDKSVLALPEPRRVRDQDHVRYVTQQSCLICGRRPSDPHHLRFAQNRALSRKVSDEFTVPLCRGHHREVHRSGDEAAWWTKAGVNPTNRKTPIQVGRDVMAKAVLSYFGIGVACSL
jgi:hypothetical protein